MSPPTGAPPRKKLRRFLLWAFLTWLVLALGLGWYSTTDSFQGMIRRRVVKELENATGGRVELGQLHTVPLRMVVDIRDVTVRGREADTETPYIHADRVLGHIKIISLLETEFGFHSLELDHPVVHIITYPDGTTNQPEPRQAAASANQGPVQPLYTFSVNRLEVHHGEVIWNERKIPLDFVASDMEVQMAYSFFKRRYEGHLLLGKVDSHIKDMRPFAWSVDTEFSLGRNNLEVKSLRATSGHTHVDASGRVEDLRDPRVEGSYDAAVDVSDAAAILRRRDVRGGVLRLNGKGKWSAADFSAAGKMLLKDVTVQRDDMILRDAGVSGEYNLSPQKLTLTQLQAKLMGGSVAGDAEVANWLARPPGEAGKSKKNNNNNEERGQVRLRLKGLSAAAVAEALSSPALPLKRMQLAGDIAGEVDGHWQGSIDRMVVQASLDSAPPARTSPGQLPLAAHMKATYRVGPGELDVPEFSAATRATQIRAGGTLSSTAAVKISASSTDLREWQPVISALRGPTQVPVEMHGRATFTGTATGNVRAVTLAGLLQMSDFDTLVPATSRTPERQVHWELFSANLQLSSRGISAREGMLRHGDTTIAFDASAGLAAGELTNQSPFTLNLRVSQAGLEELQALSGYAYPLTGRVNLTLRASGTRSNMQGSGHVQVTDGTWYGEPIEHFESDVKLAAGDVEFHNLQLSHYDGRIEGSVAYNFDQRAFRVNLTGNNFDLAKISRLQSSRFTIGGRLDFTAQGSGSVEEPSINAAIHLRDLAFNGERAGNFNFDAVTKGADMRLSGHSAFEHAELGVEGNVRLRGDWPADLTLRAREVDVDALMSIYLRDGITGHSSIAGDVRLQGPLRRPDQLNVTGDLSQLHAELQHIQIQNQGPVRFQVSNQVLTLEQFHLVGGGTDLDARGTMELTGERALDLHAQGRMNLTLIQSLNPDFTASGLVDAGVNVTGTLQNPLLQGRVQIEDGSLSYVDLPSGLSRVNGSLLFNQDRLEVEKLTAQSGGGQLNLGGYVVFGRQLSFDLTAQGQGVRLRYPPGVSSTANADLHFTGTTSASVLSGEITITKLNITPGFDFGSYLQRTSQSASLPQTSPLLNKVRLDVHVVTTPELQMQSALAKLSGDADLRVRGTAARPSLLGRVDILEGEIRINGSKYRLERGDITFTNPVTIQPVLDLEASTHVSDYDITLGVNGQADKLNITYRSEPPLPASDIIALLALGHTRDESASLSNNSSSFNQDASNAILGQALNATLSNRVQRLFGGSRIKIDPQGISTETNPNRGPQVTIEQQVADNLTLTYSTNVSQASQQIIQMEYNVTRNISIVALRDQNGVVSFDVKIRQRKK